MAKNLVIVESPAKAKTINKILGKDFVVKACMGHVRDLPPRKLGVDVKNDFAPQYVRIKGKEKVLTELKAAAKGADAVYLAPDPDREGEAIAWHLLAELQKDVAPENFFRITYNEITASAIREAFEHPGRIDQSKVDSQQARRVLDRLVGYKVSPLLWRRIRGGQSAGRVQSVALRLVCERELQIRQFVPEEFWLLGARVQKQEAPRDPFSIKLARINEDKADIKSGGQAQSILADVEGRDLIVSAIVQRDLTRKAQPPYITSTLQQAGSRFFGYSPARTMRIAQQLYEGMDFGEGPIGLITYMRTDSFAISRQAQADCRALIERQFGAAYVPEQPNIYKSRGGAQEAHEAIRPTDLARAPDSLASVLKPEELKLYRVIWDRFVASQMAPARIAQKTAEIQAAPRPGQENTYLFRVSASEVVFPGYMKVTGVEEKKKPAGEDDEPGENKIDDTVEKLPPLQEGERVDLLEWLNEQKFTQPPGRYTEASLVRALEENGVGRPSTYAQILSTLADRKYVDKDKRSLRPTEIGEKVNEFLVAHLPTLFDVGFTAGMEASLDEIEAGKIEWHGMLRTFYSQFEQWLDHMRGPDADPELVAKLLALAEGVRTWGPEIRRGKRVYSDRKFVESIREQLVKGEKKISGRQLDALKNVICRYHEQLPELAAQADALGLKEALEEAKRPPEPPRPSTLRKLQLLSGVTFQEPRQVGKKTYDDKAFADSLRQQVEGGRKLSENQLRYLDRLVMKYSDQMENFSLIAPELELDQSHDGTRVDAGPLLELFREVTEWKPPVMRGKREWDDRKFFDSLSSQFQTRKSLSFKQVASLKKMARRYSAQITDYDARAEEHGLPPRKKE